MHFVLFSPNTHSLPPAPFHCAENSMFLDTFQNLCPSSFQWANGLHWRGIYELSREETNWPRLILRPWELVDIYLQPWFHTYRISLEATAGREQKGGRANTKAAQRHPNPSQHHQSPPGPWPGEPEPFRAERSQPQRKNMCKYISSIERKSQQSLLDIQDCILFDLSFLFQTFNFFFAF